MVPRDLWKFDGCETVEDPREPLDIQGIKFIHGFLTKAGDHIHKFEYNPVVVGHSHRGGVVFKRHSSGKIAWELNAGLIDDPFHDALIYRPLKNLKF